MKLSTFIVSLALSLSGCAQNTTPSHPQSGKSPSEISNYKGTASISQGVGKTTIEDLFTCPRGRKTNVGEVVSSDGIKWVVPAATNFQDTAFPFSTDLHNACDGSLYASAKEALAQLDDSTIVGVDEGGEVFTAFIFADNYFEMYVNGVAVGKDRVPFTEFNASIVRFRAKKPFTIAMKLVDWEEHLGVGCEANRGKAFHAGDGGMVAVIKDESDAIVAKTDGSWKAQTFYTAPIKDLGCVEEVGLVRSSANCDDSGGQDGSAFYALHWKIPENWMKTDFDDSQWPKASTFTNQTIGVDNKPSYTNFTNIFDDKTNDAEFIWSSNVVLDNEVLVRRTVR